MNQSKRYKYRLGLFVTIGLIIFLAAIYLIGKEQSMFVFNIKISAVFSDVKGLRVGNNVRFSGINIGTVENLEILTDTTVIVDLVIERKVARFIKKDSKATIVSDGLMGNKIIIILSGSPEAESIREGDNLLSLDPVDFDDIINEIQRSSEKISQVSNNLIDITNKINQGEGIFGKIFTDTAFTSNIDKASLNAAIITQNLSEISEKIKEGEGIIGKMLLDTAISYNLDISSRKLAEISRNFEEITDKINRGEGVFGRLFTDTTLTTNFSQASKNISQSSENLEELTQSLIEITDKINHGRGVINKLLIDSVFADSLDIALQRLNTGLIEATEASEAIQRSRLIRVFSKKERTKSDLE